MPLIQRHIAYPLSYPNEAIYKNSPAQDMLADTHFGSMVGVLNQLGYLSTFASSIFSDLFREAEELKARMETADARTTALVSQIPQVVSQVSSLSTPQLLSYDSVTVERQLETTTAKFKLSNDTIPAQLKAIYESPQLVQPPPDFTAVEAVLLPQQKEDNGSCAEKFSNPKFFEKQWLEEQEQRLMQLAEEKAKRKAERKAQKEEERRNGGKKGQKKLKSSGKKLNWRDRMKVEDEMLFESSSTGTSAASSAFGNLVSRTPTGQRRSVKADKDMMTQAPPSALGAGGGAPPPPPPPAPAVPASFSVGAAPPPPPPPSAMQGGGNAYGASAMGSSAYAQPPPPPGGPSSTSGLSAGGPAFVQPPPPPRPKGPPVMKVKDDPMYAKYFKMLQFGIAEGAAKLKMEADGVDPSALDLDPDSPSPNAVAAGGGAASMPGDLMGGGGTGSLLDQIKGTTGMRLRKVDHVERPKPPPDPRSNLLDAIKLGNKSLKKVTREDSMRAKQPEPDASRGFNMEVLDRLNAMRNALGNDSDDDSDEDDDDW
eukprot:CAMPEP_0118974316 /NCGR_PEP_ID=MMETSP1173-20130426/11182_1 /TAXON_ID=1034831 /ORGANISM="Rhizochromulina marina cf, Strain CCMP1243" /LENGTH=539 /DNA_ID=CAMNT_0006924033 /DNA_START=77 /DNA_END=1693 /DNA_ORIENTATION=+